MFHTIRFSLFFAGNEFTVQARAFNFIFSEERKRERKKAEAARKLEIVSVFCRFFRRKNIFPPLSQSAEIYI